MATRDGPFLFPPLPDQLHRVMIMGGPGSGKSTLANELGATLGLPVIHLDSVFWQPGWVEPDRPEFAARVRNLVAADKWITEGNYSITWGDRLTRTDLVIFLDVPLWKRLPRVLRRWWRYRGRVRPDLAPGCEEQMTVAFLKYIIGYGGRSRRRALAMLKTIDGVKPAIVARDSNTVFQWLKRQPPTP